MNPEDSPSRPINTSKARRYVEISDGEFDSEISISELEDSEGDGPGLDLTRDPNEVSIWNRSEYDEVPFNDVNDSSILMFGSLIRLNSQFLEAEAVEKWNCPKIPFADPKDAFPLKGTNKVGRYRGQKFVGDKMDIKKSGKRKSIAGKLTYLIFLGLLIIAGNHILTKTVHEKIKYQFANNCAPNDDNYIMTKFIRIARIEKLSPDSAARIKACYIYTVRAGQSVRLPRRRPPADSVLTDESGLIFDHDRRIPHSELKGENCFFETDKTESPKHLNETDLRTLSGECRYLLFCAPFCAPDSNPLILLARGQNDRETVSGA